MKIKAILGVAALMAVVAMAASPAQAVPVLVDFDDLGPGLVFGSPGLTSRGFSLTPIGGSVATILNSGNCSPLCASNGTQTLVAGGIQAGPPHTNPVTMVDVGGGTFVLLGFDFAEFVQGGHISNATQISITGHIFGGGTISQLFTIDGFNDGPGGGTDFESAALIAGWASSLLTSLDFSGIKPADGNSWGFSLDNINVNSEISQRVPEPGTLAIFGLGLLGLGLARRRRKAA